MVAAVETMQLVLQSSLGQYTEIPVQCVSRHHLIAAAAHHVDACSREFASTHAPVDVGGHFTGPYDQLVGHPGRTHAPPQHRGAALRKTERAETRARRLG